MNAKMILLDNLPCPPPCALLALSFLVGLTDRWTGSQRVDVAVHRDRQRRASVRRVRELPAIFRGAEVGRRQAQMVRHYDDKGHHRQRSGSATRTMNGEFRKRTLLWHRYFLFSSLLSFLGVMNSQAVTCTTKPFCLTLQLTNNLLTQVQTSAVTSSMVL